MNNNMPDGYKQTEVGVIPVDWVAKQLVAVCSMKSGEGITSADIDEHSPFPCYGGNGLRGYANRFTHNGNYALIGRQGALCGNVLYVEGKIFASEHAIVVTPLSQTNIPWLSFVLGSMNLNQYSESSAQPGLSVSKLLALPLACPPTKAEQKAIAEALSDADALIESLEQLIAKKRQIKQGVMQELLTGKKRLPGFSGGWVDRTLRDCLLANPDYGINAPGVPISGCLPTYLRITDIDDDGRFLHANQVAVNHPYAMSYLLGENEIVFARTGASVGKAYLYNDADGELVFAGFLIRAKIDCTKLCPGFFAAFTKTSRYWNWVRMMSMRSGQPGINGNEIAALDLYLPPSLDEQTAIATTLSDMDAEITALEAKLTKARQIKQGMMQELLTGRIRLV